MHNRAFTVPPRKFRLSARVSSDNPKGVESFLRGFVKDRGTIESLEDGFRIEAELEGTSARDLNRYLLSELRKVEKRTRVRSEWTLGDVTERFFDYVPKGVRKA
jgi:hypothetical protein